MRAWPVAALATMLAAPPAIAITITQNLPAVQTLGDFTPFDITGSRFDNTLGSLISVTAELKGTVTAKSFIPLGPFPTTRQSTIYFVFTPSAIIPGPNAFTGALADQTVTPTVTSGGGLYVGAATPVDLTFNFLNTSEFIGSPSPPALLVEFGFRASLPDRTAPTGGASDQTVFDGNLALTYDYAPRRPVPEPGSLLTLGVGVLALAGCGLAGRHTRAS